MVFFGTLERGHQQWLKAVQRRWHTEVDALIFIAAKAVLAA